MARTRPRLQCIIFWSCEATEQLSPVGYLTHEHWFQMALSQKAQSRISVIFILSSRHSGSTWLGYILGSTSESAFLGEYYRAWDDHARVPCTVCAGRGLNTCRVLHGIESIPPEDAFDFAAKRTNKRTLIDSSKEFGWAARFLNRENIDVRFVHVFKDPRGWFSSFRRRHTGTLDDALAIWCKENREFRDFISSSGGRGISVSYDLLAQSPKQLFGKVFEFCNLPFDNSSLYYWNIEHHGYAANGASDALIKNLDSISPPSHFSTGDDLFYKENSQQLFHDSRWQAELTFKENMAIQRNSEVKDLLDTLGFQLTEVSITSSQKGLLSRIWDSVRLSHYH